MADSVTLEISFPVVDGELVIDPIKLHLVGRTEDELRRYALKAVHNLRTGDWVATLTSTIPAQADDGG